MTDLIKKIEYYNNLGFVCIPLKGKVPFLKKWNELTETPSLKVFTTSNIGVLTGKPSGITVLDIDFKDKGMIIWNKIKTLYPKFKTPTVITPNKGIHMYFKYTKKLSSFSKFNLNGEKIGWDILNGNRQVVIPPSIDIKNNKAYRWLISPDSTPLIEMPSWLIGYILYVH
jgi:hypothetical protein